MADSVTTWIGQLRDGNVAAAEALWERYFHRLTSVARNRLRGTSRRAADEEDVALSAFHSMCRNVERFPRLSNRQDLWQVLVMLAARKAFQERRRQQAAKRGGQTTADGQRLTAPECGDVEIEAIIGTEPSPDFAVTVAEMHQLLLAKLPSDDLRQVAELRLEDHTNREIAERMGCSERSVERKLSLIRGLWEEATVD